MFNHYKKTKKKLNKGFTLVEILVVLVIVAILVAPILNSSDYKYFKHALEWNYFLGVVTFYLLTSVFLKLNSKEQ